MMKAKHTPGPWELHYDAGEDEGTLSIRMATAIKNRGMYNTAHEIILYEGTWPDENDDHGEMLANARLISVAPDLLAESKKLIEWLERVASHSEKQAKDTRFETMREAYEADAKNFRASAKAMKALIAKAEGK